MKSPRRWHRLPRTQTREETGLDAKRIVLGTLLVLTVTSLSGTIMPKKHASEEPEAHL